jgi:hypothetical protein
LKAKVSHILRPGNTAFKEQLKLVNGFEGYMRLKKPKKLVKGDLDSGLSPSANICKLNIQ